jgi:hypothetical protein
VGTLTRTTRAIIGLFTGSDPSKPDVPSIKKLNTLEQYLNKSYQKVKADGKLGPTELGLRTSIPVSIFLQGSGDQHIYAGNSDTFGGVLHRLDDEEYFSASLVKVAAMFAAFALRAEARALIDDIKAGTVTSTTATDFFSKLAAGFNPNDAVTDIKNATGIQRKPTLTEVLSVTGFPTASALAADFSAEFRSHMRKMIVPSDDCSAGECIWRLSYPYINVKLMLAGFFDAASMKGIWLAGDYIIGTCPPATRARKQNFVRIKTINDCDQTTTPPFCGSAQNTTSRLMAKLYLQILLGTLVDSDSSQEMLTLLQEGQKGSDRVDPPVTVPPIWNHPAPDPAFLTRASDVTITRKFKVDAVKIGQGPIKTDHDRGDIEVRSEGIVIVWKDTSEFAKYHLTGQAAVCYQNIPNDISLNGVVEIINTAVDNFIAQAPLTP